jgi:hypothetical protein
MKYKVSSDKKVEDDFNAKGVVINVSMAQSPVS